MIGIDNLRQFEIRINLIHFSLFLELLFFLSFPAYSQNIEYSDNEQHNQVTKDSVAPTLPLSLVPSLSLESDGDNNASSQLVSPGGIVISNLDEISPD